MKRFVCGITAVLLAAAAMMAGCSASKKEESFTPRLDLDADIQLDITGFFGNFEALKAGDEEAAGAALSPAVELVDELVAKGYTDAAVNAEYPEDNYDQAILRFFEGDVPFWMCNTEKVSGMKKREFKSEAFQKAPFSYAFIYPPLGEDGAYCYQEPWFGFAASASGPHTDYAVEFLRFLATEKEINQMASVKGIPSVAVKSEVPEIYRNVINEDVAKTSIINQGEVTPDMVEAWYSGIAKYAAGGYASAQELLEEFLGVCAREMDCK